MYADGLSLTHWTTGEFASQNKLVKVLTLDYAYKPHNDVYDISITFRKVTKVVFNSAKSYPIHYWIFALIGNSLYQASKHISFSERPNDT